MTTQLAEAPEAVETPPGFGIDTCDTCGPGTQAWVWVEMPDGKELTYCGHHGKKYAAELAKQAKAVNDLTYIALSR